jgi:hypothetical protein
MFTKNQLYYSSCSDNVHLYFFNKDQLEKITRDLPPTKTP